MLSGFGWDEAQFGVIKVVDFAISTCEYVQTRLLIAFSRLAMIIAIVSIAGG